MVMLGGRRGVWRRKGILFVVGMMACVLPKLSHVLNLQSLTSHPPLVAIDMEMRRGLMCK